MSRRCYTVGTTARNSHVLREMTEGRGRGKRFFIFNSSIFYLLSFVRGISLFLSVTYVSLWNHSLLEPKLRRDIEDQYTGTPSMTLKVSDQKE